MRRNKTNKSYKSNKGFTLIETIIAIGVILTALVGVLILSSQSTKSIRAADRRMVAAHLAQEGVEVIIGIRDSNWLGNLPWRTNLPATAQGIVDYNSMAVTVVSNPDNYCLSFLSGVYRHDTPPCNSLFSRHIEIIDRTELIGAITVPFIEVKAVASWSEDGIIRSISVVDHLYDWK